MVGSCCVVLCVPGLIRMFVAKTFDPYGLSFVRRRTDWSPSGLDRYESETEPEACRAQDQKRIHRFEPNCLPNRCAGGIVVPMRAIRGVPRIGLSPTALLVDDMNTLQGLLWLKLERRYAKQIHLGCLVMARAS